MTRPIRVSVPVSLAVTDDSERRAYLEEIETLGLDVELFTSTPRLMGGSIGGFVNEELRNSSGVARLRDLGISVESVHATPLRAGCSGSGAKACADKVVDAQFAFADEDTPPDEPPRRERYCDVSLFVFHPPRFYASEHYDLGMLRQRLVGTLGNARERLEADDLIDDVPTLTIENVCPRGPYDYLLTESDDVDRFGAARRDLQAAQDDDVVVPAVDYTLDIGHAPDPFAMLDALETPEHVHLHGSIPADDETRKRELRERYDVDDDTALGSTEPPGQIQHLPPQDGRHALPKILDALDDADYTGPLTLELARPYWNADTLVETVEAIQAYA